MSEAASTEGMGPSASRGHGRFFRKRRGGHLQRERPGQCWGGGLDSSCELSAQLETNSSDFTDGRRDAGRATGWPSPLLTATDRT